MIALTNLKEITVNQAGIGTDTAESERPVLNERIVLVSSSLYLHGDVLDLFGLAVDGGGVNSVSLVYLATFGAAEYVTSVSRWMMILPRGAYLILTATAANAGCYAVGTVVYAKMTEMELGLSGGRGISDVADSGCEVLRVGWFDRLFSGDSLL